MRLIPENPARICYHGSQMSANADRFFGKWI